MISPHWPVSRPRKFTDELPDNPMDIITGWGKTLTIDWIYWQYAWEIVYSDAGSFDI
jgi:hypothetical protein